MTSCYRRDGIRFNRKFLAVKQACRKDTVIGARYLAIGTGDTELYVFAGMLAAVVISIRVFLFRGAGKAN
jgi:hypothetical protein